MQKYCIIALALFLTGCTESFRAITGNEKPGTRVDWPTPALVTYPEPFTTQLARELEAIPDNSPIGQTVADYLDLRRGVCVIDNWQQAACQRIKEKEHALSDRQPDHFARDVPGDGSGQTAPERPLPDHN